MSGSSSPSDRESSLAEHLSHIRIVHAALADRLNLVFMGGKVLALYAKTTGDALRTTTDVDSLLDMEFGPRQRALQDLQARRVISPISEPGAPPCRYRLLASGITVDIVDLDGHATGGANPHHRRAVAECALYSAGENVLVRAITPPFFLLTKLVSLRDAGRTALSPEHHDAEDIVVLFAEVDDLVEQIIRAGVLDDVRRDFRETLAALSIRDPSYFLELWLPRGVPGRDRILEDFFRVATMPTDATITT